MLAGWIHRRHLFLVYHVALTFLSKESTSDGETDTMLKSVLSRKAEKGWLEAWSLSFSWMVALVVFLAWVLMVVCELPGRFPSFFYLKASLNIFMYFFNETLFILRLIKVRILI